MNNRTVYPTLAVLVVLGCLFTLITYKWRGGNPSTRVGYSVFAALLPAVATIVVLKFTNFFISWRGVVLPNWATTALIYLLLFLLVFVANFLMVLKT